MRRLLSSIGLGLLALTLSAPVAMAQQSASFMMTDDYGGTANVAPSTAAGFEQTDANRTWFEGQGTASHFRLVGSEEVPVGGTGGSSGGSTGGTGGAGSTNSGQAGSSGQTGGAAGGVHQAASSSSQSEQPVAPQPEYHPARTPIGKPAPFVNEDFGSTVKEDLLRLLSTPFIRNAEHRASTGPGLRFFDALDDYSMPAKEEVTTTIVKDNALLIVILWTLACALMCWLVTSQKRLHVLWRRKKFRARVRFAACIFTGVLIALALLLMPFNAFAENVTVSPKRLYKGNLFDASGHAVTTSVDIRFSYWNSTDYLSGDTTATGAINTGASHFLGWYETKTVTPNSNGAFTVILGTTRSLVNLKTISPANLLSLHLQVEVKNSGEPDTAYELLDIDSGDSAVDRSQILAVPLARNSDLLDQHDSGTGATDIPFLDGLGKLPTSVVPGGTNNNTFAVDADGTSTGTVTLQFGTGLAQRIQYDTANARFDFLSDVMIHGDLTVTGMINGIDFGALQSSTGGLKATRGTGLSINVSGGSYRLNGAVTNFPGTSGVSLTANQTNYVFFGSGGLTTNTSGFPADESFIPVAEVVTDGSDITALADRRVMNSDDRESDMEKAYYPQFEHASYQGDGADNVGQLTVGYDDTTKKNFYQWSSTRASLQDYDIIVKMHLPAEFVRWQSGGANNSLALEYRSTSASNGVTKADVQVYDTNGVPVTLSGSVTGLAGLSWSATGIEFGSATWTPDQDFVVKIHVSAKDAEQMHIGALKLRYVEFKQ